MGLAERLTLIIDAKTGGAIKEFDKVAKSTKDLEAGTGRGTKALQSMGLSGKVSGEAIASGLGVAGAAAVAFAAKSIAHFQDAALGVRAFQRVTGQSAEEASHFVAALDDMGISAEQGSASMFKLSKNISTGGKALTDLGIGIAHTASGTTDLKETFLNIADAVAKTPDPAKRAEIAFAAFGKTGASLLPILEKGRVGIEKLFKGADLNFTQKQLDSAEDYRLAMDHLSDSVGKVQNRIGSALVPPLADATEGFAVLVDKGLAAKDSSGLLGRSLDFLGDVALNTVAPGLQGIGAGLGLFSDGADDAEFSAGELAKAESDLGFATGSLVGKTKAQVAALAEEKKALLDVLDATLAQFDAQLGYEQAVNGVEDAVAAAAEKQKELNQAIREHGANSAEAKAATEALSRAQLDEEQALLRAAQAAARVAEEDAKLNGVTDATIPKIDAQIAVLQSLGATADGPVKAQIQALITKLEGIKSEYSTTVTANTTPAVNQLSDLQRLLGNITGQTHQVPVTVTGVPLPRTTRPSNRQGLYPGLASGGIVPARPGGTTVVLGEGGQDEAVVPLPPGGGGFGSTNVIINMPPGADGDDVVNAFRRWERRNGPYRF